MTEDATDGYGEDVGYEQDESCGIYRLNTEVTKLHNVRGEALLLLRSSQRPLLLSDLGATWCLQPSRSKPRRLLGTCLLTETSL